MEKKIVNCHYIGVVKEVDEFLIYQNVDIPQDDILISEIDTMMDNDNLSLLNIQQRFMIAYPHEHLGGYSYNYLFPYSYNAVYVRQANYPQILSSDDYKMRIQEKEASLRNKYFLSKEAKELLTLIKSASEEKYNRHIAKLEENIVIEVTDYIKSLRKSFDYKRFIYAHNYHTKLYEISKDTNIRMFSTDQIGWKNFQYKISNDFTVYILTNFGYGNSSYLYCNIKYKDINILPFSWTVKYYFVKMQDFIRYTRRYEPKRQSWSEVFEFTVLTANMAKHEPEKFINEWIINEVKDMMKGMRQYMSNPKKSFGDFTKKGKEYNNTSSNKISGYTYKDVIRHINNTDIEEYKALPEEKTIAFKAEKITGCLLLLDNLRRLSEISPVINSYITEIEKMNIKLLPEIDRFIINISDDIKQLNNNLNEIKTILKTLNQELDNNKREIKLLQKEINEKREDSNKINEYDTNIIYINNHPKYSDLLKKIEKATVSKDELEKDIRRRKKFHEILQNCKKSIKEYIQVT